MADTVSSRKAQILVAVFTLFFACVSWLSLSSIRQLQGNARVINYVGIVRGATQRLIKKELQDFPDNTLIARLNGIVEELITGEGPNGLIVLHDETYLENMNRVRASWTEIKKEIEKIRAAGDKTRLYNLSEDYFVLVDRTVSSAEAYSEHQVERSKTILVGINVIFVLMLVVGLTYYLRTVALKRRTEQLRKIAYFDPMTKLPNRAGCEREIHSMNGEVAPEDIAVFMFDMNNLKKANDQLGHNGGDRLIADFGAILGDAAGDRGFVGRYGGDEFVGVYKDCDSRTAEQFLAAVNEKVVAYNLLRVNDIEKLSFAAGHVIGNLRDTDIESMLNEADRRMYIRKRQMKEYRD